MTTSTSAVAALESLINRGAFASRARTYLDHSIRHSRYETFYSRALATEGLAEAERQLIQWDEQRHCTLYASCVEPIVRGIVALAKAKGDSLIDITACTPIAYTRIKTQYGPRNKFIVFNTQAPGCGCMQPAESYTFGPSGELGLQAVILETGHGYDGPKTELSLVLPAWGTTRYPPNPGEFVIVRFETTGNSGGDRYTPYIHTDGGPSRNFNDANAFLTYMLGMNSVEDLVDTMQTSSGIDTVIGFPGAEDYLAAKLPLLGDYFNALAEKIATPHTH